MFRQTGVDIELVKNDATGKFDAKVSTSGPNIGNPAFSNTRSHAVLTTLMSRKRGQRPGDQVQGGGYYGDPQNRRGTLLWTVTQDRTITGSQLVAYAEDGGRQLAEMRLISGFTARALKLGPAKWRIECAWTLPDGSKGAVDLT
mgnify:FL=1